MADNKDITLRIRAKDYSKQTFDSLTKTVGRLSAAMEDQRDAAKKGEASAKDLESSYLELEKAAKAVIRQAADVKAFENQAQALEKTRRAAIEAANAEGVFAAKLAAQDKVTREQSKQMTELTRTRERSQRAVQTQTDSLQKLGQRLAQYGVAVNNTDSSLKAMSGVIDTTNRALKAQDDAIMSNAQHLADLAAARKKAESEESAQALKRQQEALRQLAQEQKAVANGWTSAAASMRQMSSATPSLGQQIQALLNPTAEATRTLTGIGKTATDLGTAATKARGPLKDFGDTIKSLKEAQGSVASLAQLVDAYRKQVTTLRQMRAEYQTARQNVMALTAAMTQTGANTQDISAKLRQAQAELKRSSEAFNQMSAAARQTQQQLRQAGIDTRNLQAAEQQIITTTQQVRTATDQVTEAYRKYGAAARGATDRTKLFDTSGKTALSMFQRLRGEVLSLAAAYGGVFGAMNLATAAVDAAIVKQQTLAAVSVAVGRDQNKQAAEWEYINRVADHFGANLESMAKAYGKFSAAAAGSGMKGDQTKELFENITSIGTAYGKTSDQMNLVFLAVEQMLSKGAIQAEEFKNQFGEQIPGAYEAGAKALGISLDDFKKKQQAGVLDAQAVITIMRGLAKDSQSAAEQMRSGIVATQNELDNAKFRFNLALADSGFLDAYRELLQKVTALLSGPDGKELASALSSAFSTIADAAQFLVENLELVKWVLANIAFVKAIELGVSFGRSLKSIGGLAKEAAGLLGKGGDAVTTWGARLGTATVATRVLAGAMKLLGRAIPVLGWILLALDIGKVLYDQSETVRTIVDGMIKYATVAFEYLKNIISGSYQTWDQTMTAYENRAKGAEEAAKKAAQLQKDLDAATGRSGGFQRTVTDSGYNDAAVNEKEFNKKLDKLKEKLAKQSLSQQRRLAKDDLSERLDLIRESYAEQLATATKYGGETLKRTQALIEQAVENERKAYKADHAKSGDGGANKRANLVSSTVTDLEQAESRAAKKTSFTDPNTSYAEREKTAVQAAVDGYKDLEARIAKIAQFDKDGAAGMQARVDALRQQTTEATKQQIAIEELTRLQGKMKSVQDEQKNRQELINAEYEAGIISESEKVAKLNALYGEMKPKILESITALREFAMAQKDAMSPEAFQALMTSLDTLQVKTENAKGSVESFYTSLVGGLLNGVGTAFNSITDSLAQVYQGTMSWGDAINAVGTTMMQFFADLMRDLAMAILKTMILKSLSGMAGGGGIMGSIGTAASGMVGQNHSGGMAGGGGGPKRAISVSAFSGAPKFHEGGVVPGLKGDEVPSILQKGEEVLTRADPRHILNGGGAAGPQGIRLIAVDDQRTATAEALKTPQGQQALIVAMRAQLPTIKQMVR